MSSRVALIIGIDAYSVFAPGGQADLQGGMNNAATCLAFARAAGVQDADIRVLLSGLQAQDHRFDGFDVKQATALNIREAFAWLAGRLAAADSAGLMAWSGHSAYLRGRLALCPSDLSPSMDNALTAAEMEALLTGEGKLTLFLETCGAAALQPDMAAVSDDLVQEVRNTVILAACGADQQAAEYPFHGIWRGAFTHALDLMLASPFRPARMSPEELVRRAGVILEALSIPQQPVVIGAPERQGEAILGTGLPVKKESHHSELWPNTTGPGFTVFTVMNNSNSTIGYVVTIGASAINISVSGTVYTWKSSRSYWFSTGGSSYFNNTFKLRAWSYGDNNNAPDFNSSNLYHFTANIYKPVNALVVFENVIPTQSPASLNLNIEYEVKSAAGTLIGYLNANLSQMAWYFVNGGLSTFQAAQQSFNIVTFTHGNGTPSGQFTAVTDENTIP